MFLLNSRYPLVCAPSTWLPKQRASFSRSYGGNLPSSFSTVLSSALVYSTSPPVSVWGTVYTRGLFPGTPSRPGQSNKPGQHTASVTICRLRNIHLVPIDYAFPPRLRGRLTLRRLALRRNPWTYGESVSHTALSLLMSAFALPIPPGGLTALPSQAYGTLRYRLLSCYSKPKASAHGLSPVTLSAQGPLFRPVSCYAFFK